VLLSFISLLSDPNTSSPANVDASVEWRRDRTRYVERVRALCAKSRKSVPPHVRIPHPDSNPEEHRQQVERIKAAERPMEIDEFQDFMELPEDEMMLDGDDAFEAEDDQD
jgi:ubiquitin-conjugating enzyme E2 R